MKPNKYLLPKSIALTQNGRKIIMLKLGRGKRPILYIGAHHGNEYITSAFLMGMCEYLMSLAKENNPHIINFFEEYSLYVVPMLNPDGVSISQFSSIYERNHKHLETILPKPHTLYKANASGVDLNLNYPCLFEGVVSSDKPAFEKYKGIEPLCERETQIIDSLCNTFDFTYSLTFHAFGEEIRYSDFYSKDVPYSYFLAQKISCLSGIEILPSADTADNFGGFENYFRKKFNRPCIFIKLGTDCSEDLNYLNTGKYQKLKSLPLYIYKSLRGIML